jgi:endoglycosylceramidase
VGLAFDRLYSNQSGLLPAFIGFWDAVVKSVAKEDFVLGYELINEPWPGDVYRHPNLLVPGVADKEVLFPLYKTLHNSIRSLDDQHIIFFEKALTDVIGATGFPSGPGGNSYNDRQAYSYHVYCLTDAQGNPRNAMECDGEDLVLWQTFMSDIKRLQCGSFLTEFGAEDNVTTSLSNIGYLTELAESHLQSWAYWQYKYYDDLTTSGKGEAFYNADGELETDKVRALSRTYAYAIAGVPTSTSFDSASSRFTLTYTLNTAISAPTEIYLNEAWYYANGYAVVITPSTAVSWSSPQKNRIYLTPSSAAQNGVSVTVTITKK